MKKYAKLWHKFKEKEFTYREVTALFKGENINVIRTMISQLRKCGWLSVELDPKDSRIRIYKLKEPNEIVKDMLD
tara:strand:+ start:111 stop:335 length:225 start_codon:yes stop_codon:yes gene_type:complete